MYLNKCKQGLTNYRISIFIISISLLLFIGFEIFIYNKTYNIELIPETIETINYLLTQNEEFRKIIGESSQQLEVIPKVIIKYGEKPYLFFRDNKIKIDPLLAGKIINLNSNLLNRKLALMRKIKIDKIESAFNSAESVSKIKSLFVQDKINDHSPIGGIVMIKNNQKDGASLIFYQIEGDFENLAKEIIPLKENPDGLQNRLKKALLNDEDELRGIWDEQMIKQFAFRNLKESRKESDRIKFSKYLVEKSFLDLADATYRPSEKAFINLLLENKLEAEYLGNFMTMNFGGFEVPNISSFVADDDRWFAIALRSYGFEIFCFDKQKEIPSSKSKLFQQVPIIKVRVKNFTEFFKENVD